MARKVTSVYDAQDIKFAAANRWDEILVNVGGIEPRYLEFRSTECECPKCGGTTRFRYNDPPQGAVRCSHCFDEKNGDGIAAVQWLQDCGFQNSLTLIGDYLGVKPNPLKGPRPSRSKPNPGGGPANQEPKKKKPSKIGDPTKKLKFNPVFDEEYRRIFAEAKGNISLDVLFNVGVAEICPSYVQGCPRRNPELGRRKPMASKDLRQNVQGVQGSALYLYIGLYTYPLF